MSRLSSNPVLDDRMFVNPVELQSGFCGNYLYRLFPNSNCSIKMRSGEKLQIDEKDRDKNHHCCSNLWLLCPSCNCKKRELQARSESDNLMITDACQCCGLVRSYPEFTVRNSNHSMRKTNHLSLYDYHKLHSHVCVSESQPSLAKEREFASDTPLDVF